MNDKMARTPWKANGQLRGWVHAVKIAKGFVPLAVLGTGVVLIIGNLVIMNVAPAPAPQHVGMMSLGGFIAGAVVTLAGLALDAGRPKILREVDTND